MCLAAAAAMTLPCCDADNIPILGQQTPMGCRRLENVL
jgi:hypothetical protein